MIDFPEKINYSKYYNRTIKRILEGYRFPSDIPDQIYAVYGDYAHRLEHPTALHSQYLVLLKELLPEWKPKKTKEEIIESSFNEKNNRTVFRYSLKGDLIATYKSAYDAFMETGYPIDSIVEACKADNYKIYKNSYWYFRMMHPKVREKILEKKGKFPSKK